MYNPSTGRGLYQFYYQSATIHSFFDLLAILFKEHKQECIDANATDDLTQVEEKRQKIDLKRRLKGSVIVKKDQLAKLVEQLELIKSIDLEFSTITPIEDSDLWGIASQAKHHYHRFTFSKDASRIIKSKMVAFLEKNQTVDSLLKKANIRGITPSGLEQLYSLVNNPDKLGEGDYDDWIQEMTLDSSKWGECLAEANVIKKLLHVTTEKRVRAILTAPANA